MIRHGLDEHVEGIARSALAQVHPTDDKPSPWTRDKATMKSPKAIEVKGEWAEPMSGQHTKKAAKHKAGFSMLRGWKGTRCKS